MSKLPWEILVNKQDIHFENAVTQEFVDHYQQVFFLLLKSKYQSVPYVTCLRLLENLLLEILV